jgi:hypothetical protein
MTGHIPAFSRRRKVRQVVETNRTEGGVIPHGRIALAGANWAVEITDHGASVSANEKT